MPLPPEVLAHRPPSVRVLLPEGSLLGIVSPWSFAAAGPLVCVPWLGATALAGFVRAARERDASLGLSLDAADAGHLRHALIALEREVAASGYARPIVLHAREVAADAEAALAIVSAGFVSATLRPSRPAELRAGAAPFLERELWVEVACDAMSAPAFAAAVPGIVPAVHAGELAAATAQLGGSRPSCIGRPPRGVLAARVEAGQELAVRLAASLPDALQEEARRAAAEQGVPLARALLGLTAMIDALPSLPRARFEAKAWAEAQELFVSAGAAGSGSRALAVLAAAGR